MSVDVKRGKQYVREDGKITAPIVYAQWACGRPWYDPEHAISYSILGQETPGIVKPTDLRMEYVQPAPVEPVSDMQKLADAINRLADAILTHASKEDSDG